MTERLGLVARKDFYDSIRENQIYYIGTLFVLIAVGIGYLGGNAAVEGFELVPPLVATFFFLVTVVTLTISHDAISDKWVSGELTVLLGLPISRFDVVYGSVLGRTAAVSLVTVVSVLLSTVVAVALGASPDLAQLVVGLLGLLTAVAIFASLAVAFSALSDSTTVSSTAAFGAFALFVFQLWSLLPSLVNLALDGVGAPTIPDDTIEVWNNLTPFSGIRNAGGAVLESADQVLGVFAAGSLPASPPAHQHPVFGVLVVLFWAVVPVTLAYLRFDSDDI